MEEIKLYDIIVLSEQEEDYTIQLFGLNEKKESYCLFVQEFKPFFYIKVPSVFQIADKEDLLSFIKSKIYKKYEDIEIEIKLIKRKQLYGFDGKQKYKFVCLTFQNIKNPNN